MGPSRREDWLGSYIYVMCDIRSAVNGYGGRLEYTRTTLNKSDLCVVRLEP
jgi:hypothetical protein